jgi:hypothetical protein
MACALSSGGLSGGCDADRITTKRHIYVPKVTDCIEHTPREVVTNLHWLRILRLLSSPKAPP